MTDPRLTWLRRPIWRHRRHRHDELGCLTPWTHYMRVGSRGEHVIGVLRWEMAASAWRVEEMYRLPADHDPADVQLKLAEAKDRAASYSNSRDD